MQNEPFDNGFVEEKETQNNRGIFNYSLLSESPSERQKRKIRSAARIIGVPYIVILVISAFWANVYLFFVRELGISQIKAIDFINGDGARQILQIFLSIIMFTLPFIFAVMLSKKRVSDLVILSKPEKRTVLPCFLLGVSVCFFSSTAVSYAGMFFKSFGIEYSVDFGKNPSGFFGVLLALLSTAIVPALVEEFAMRGVVLGVLLPFGEAFSVITSAVLFGIMHGNFEQMPFAFLVGLVLGYIRIKTGSLWPCILVHFTNNLFSVTFDYISNSVSDSVMSAIYTVVVCVAILGLFPAVVLLQKRMGKNAFSFENGETEVKEKDKYKWFFTSVFIVLPIVWYLLKAVKYFV